MSIRIKYLVFAFMLALSMVVTSCDKPDRRNENPVNTENTNITDDADDADETDITDIITNTEKTTLTIYAPYISNKEYKRVRRVFDEIEKQLSKTLNLGFDIRLMWDIPEARSELGKRNISFIEYDNGEIPVEAENALLEGFLKLEQPFDLMIFPIFGSHIDTLAKDS